MVWAGFPGSGDLYLSSGDTFIFGVASGQSLNVKQFTVTGSAQQTNGNYLIISTDATAAEGPGLELIRRSASPAIGDQIGAVYVKGRDSALTELSMFKLGPGQMDQVQANSVTCVVPLTTRYKGTLAVRQNWGGGTWAPTATGSDQGIGTANFTAVYDDGVLLSCYVIEAERRGNIDLKDFDEATLNRVYERIDETTGRRERVEEVLTHSPAREFKKRIPQTLDPKQFAQKWMTDGHLPGLPSRQEWIDHSAAGRKYSTGDLVQKLLELAEVQAVHTKRLLDRIEIIETVVNS